jgi:hypothetical protein
MTAVARRCMDTKLDQVRADHRELNRTAAALEGELLKSCPDVHGAFARLSSFSSHLAEHLANDDDLLRALIEVQAGIQSQTLQMECELDSLRWDWEEFLSGWTVETAAADCEVFAEHASVMLARIRRRIASEDEFLSRFFAA